MPNSKNSAIKSRTIERNFLQPSSLKIQVPNFWFHQFISIASFRGRWKWRTWKWRIIKMYKHEFDGSKIDGPSVQTWNWRTWKWRTNL